MNSAVTRVRGVVALVGLSLALVGLARMQAEAWPIYLVFTILAVAFNFVWLDVDAPAALPYLATATAFIYIGGLPILACELVARVIAYPLLLACARRGWLPIAPPLRGLLDHDPSVVRRTTVDLAAMFALGAIGSTVRVLTVTLLRDSGGLADPMLRLPIAEVIALASQGLLNAALPLPTSGYTARDTARITLDDERLDVIYVSSLFSPLLVCVINYGYLRHGLAAAAVWSVATLAPHALMAVLVARRRSMVARHDALERANAALAAKQREVEEFAYTIAHELKAPLSAITLLTDMVLERHIDHLDDRARHDLGRVIRLAGETEHMIVDLLNFVRIVAAPEPAGAVDLDDLVQRAAEPLRPQLTARRVALHIAPLGVAFGQPAKLLHVVSNLLGNAVKFVPAERGWVRIAADRSAEGLTLSFEDNGPGIPEEYRTNIFGLFSRGPDPDGSVAPLGAGIGLAIVKRVVEAHGGTVWIEASPCGGSTFRVRLPLAPMGG